jgi:hypothetical protein
MALWFNEMQNYVNVQLLKRLVNEHKRILSYQEEIDAQQPSQSDCPTCWATRKGIKSKIVELKNDDMIFKYLKYHYGRQTNSKLMESLKEELLTPAPPSVVFITKSTDASNTTTPSSAPYGSTYNESDHYFTATATPEKNYHQGASTMVVLALLGMVVRVGMHSSSTRRASKTNSICNLYDVDTYMHDKQA